MVSRYFLFWTSNNGVRYSGKGIGETADPTGIPVRMVVFVLIYLSKAKHAVLLLSMDSTHRRSCGGRSSDPTTTATTEVFETKTSLTPPKQIRFPFLMQIQNRLTSPYIPTGAILIPIRNPLGVLLFALFSLFSPFSTSQSFHLQVAITLLVSKFWIDFTIDRLASPSTIYRSHCIQDSSTARC